MKFDYQESLRAMPQPLTQQRWTELTTSELVNRAVYDFQHGDAKAKKRLPAVMWQATFNGKARKMRMRNQADYTCSIWITLKVTQLKLPARLWQRWTNVALC